MLWVIASGLQQPDDLLYDRDGSILVGEYSAGKIARIGGPSGVERLPVSVSEPEGIARIGETLYVADQLHARVVAIDGGGNVRTFLQLAPVASGQNLDQIASQGDTLIVPDSPHGTVLFVDQSGQVTRRVGGFGRPVGAWPLPDGSVLISDENLAGVFQLMADGTRKKLASLAVADDAVDVPDGRVFAISESNGLLIQVGGGTFVSGLKTAQGLAVDGAGNLLVTESAAGRVDAVLLAFKLQPARVDVVALAPGQPICVTVARASGFRDTVQLGANSDYMVVRQPEGDQPGEVVPRNCESGHCSLHVVAQSGSRSDGIWVNYRNG
jgi:DNA-binding beta-propeller fold protein YncE